MVMSVETCGALVAPQVRQGGATMVKAKVIRGVYVRGTAYPEGAIVEVTPIELAELKATNYLVEAREEPAQQVEARDPPRRARVE